MNYYSFDERLKMAEPLAETSQEEVMKQMPCFSETELGTYSERDSATKETGVLVFNIERGVYLEECIEFLKDCPEIRPFDIILANELDHGCARTGNRDVAKELAKALGLNYVWGLEFIELVNQEDKTGFHGNAIFSKSPITDAFVVRLPEEYNWYFDRQKRIGGRMAVGAVTELNGKQAGIVSVHLENRTDGLGRCRQMAHLFEELDKRFHDMPVIVGGDLNTNTFDGRSVESIQEIAASKELRQRCLQDVEIYENLLSEAVRYGYSVFPDTPCVTRRKPLPGGDVLGLRLDWILTKGMLVKESRMVSVEKQDFYFAKKGGKLEAFQEKELSDHNAVYLKGGVL